MTIEGDYTLFAHLETIYLGVLARRTLISTNVRRVVEAANGKPILFFPARSTTGTFRPATGRPRTSRAPSASPPTRRPRGGAGGASEPFRTRSSRRTAGTRCSRRRSSPTASRPATSSCSWTSRTTRCAPPWRWPRSRPAAVGRAAGHLAADGRPLSLARDGRLRPTGVVPELVRKVREALDDDGHERVRIVASGGFDAERIRAFEAAGVPVDAYGVGTVALRGDERLHRRRRPDGRPSLGQGRPPLPAEPAARARRVSLDVRPLTPERWADFVELFERRGPRGGRKNVPAYGCWCMYWRDRSVGHGDPKKRAMGKIVRAGKEPGSWRTRTATRSDGSPSLRASRTRRCSARRSTARTRTRRACGRSSASRWIATRAAQG